MYNLMSPNDLLSYIKQRITKNQRFAFIISTIITVIIHFPMFIGIMTNEDMLSYRIYSANHVGIGRWAEFIVRWTQYIVPVFIGVMCTLLLSLAVTCVITIFNVKSNSSIILISLLMITFPVLAYSFGYQFMIINYSAALCLSVLSVWIVQKFRYSWILGSVMLAVSMGLYQSYVGSSMTLCVLLSILYILDNRPTIKNFLKFVFKFILYGLLAVIFYFIGLKLTLFLSQTTLADYKGISEIGKIPYNKIPELVIRTYKNFISFFSGRAFLHASFLIRIVYIINLSACLVLFIYMICVKVKRYWSNIILLILLLIALPVCINIIDFIAPNASASTLTIYQLVYIWCFPLVIYDRLQGKPESKAVLSVVAEWGVYITSLILIINFGIISNIYYVKLDTYTQRTLMLNERILTRIETLPEFDDGVKLAIISNSTNPPYDIKDSTFDAIQYDIGLRNQFIGLTENRIQISSWKLCALINNDFGMNLIPATEDEINEIMSDSRYSNMGIWPEASSVAVYDGIIVVNFLYPIQIERVNDEYKTIFRVKNIEYLPEDCTFAWYLYENDNKIDVQWYSNSRTYMYDSKINNKYYVTLFIKDANENIVQILNSAIFNDD